MVARGVAWLDAGRRLEVAWLAFALVNLAAMLWVIASRSLSGWETVPFHFIYVSFTLLYGFRAWQLRQTMLGLVFVIVSTGALTIWAVVVRWEAVPEVTEIPLMALMFAAMVFHVRRRQQATAVAEAIATARADDLERQQVFVSDASHELLTPITIARGHVEVLRRGGAFEPADVTEACDVVVGELERMARLIDRLLVIERAASLSPADRAPVSAAALLEQLHQRWQAAAPREWRLGPLADAIVTADADQLMLALDALVENAVQHTAPDDRITISSRGTASRIEIAVRDSGPGVPAEALDRIFDRFYRVDAARNRRWGGSGLGLSIVRAVARAHGGDVRASNSPTGGAEFVLVLPVAVLAAAEPVAAAHGLDGDVGGELAAQAPDRHVDDVGAGVELVVPDGVQDPLA
jgi:signal transduction histidine kinase